MFYPKTDQAQKTALLLKEEIFQYERIRVFGEIWSALLSRPKWVAREQEILKKEAGRRFSPELQFGRLHLEFLQKNDDVIFAEAFHSAIGTYKGALPAGIDPLPQK